VLLETEYIKSASDLLHNLSLDGRTIKACQRALEIIDFPDETAKIKYLLSKNDALAIRCAAAINDTLQEKNLLAKVDAIISGDECYTLDNLAIKGRDLITLGYAPGKELGRILDALLMHVIENPEDNKLDVLYDLLKQKNDPVVST